MTEKRLKIGIVCDAYKSEIFKLHLNRAKFLYDFNENFQPNQSLFMVYVNAGEKDHLEKVVREANDDAVKLKVIGRADNLQ